MGTYAVRNLDHDDIRRAKDRARQGNVNLDDLIRQLILVVGDRPPGAPILPLTIQPPGQDD